MPLLLSALKTSPGLPGAGGADYPATRIACAQAWADAAQAWAAGIVPASTAVTAAAASLATALNSAFGGASSAAVASAMESAFLAFATAIGVGMAGYTPVPPPGPIGFSTLFATNASTRQAGVDKVADALDTWMRTGSSTLIAPPNTVVDWT